MRQRVILLGVAGAAVMLAAVACGQESGQQEQAAIRLVAESFVKAYNRGDSQAIAQLFTPEALIVGANGVSTHGREAIEQVFAEVFKRHPQTQMKIVIGAIRAVSPGVAIEEGTSTVTYTSGEPAEQGRYVVVHVLRDGQWRMASARDVTAEPLPAEEQLKQLAGLIGDWVDEGPDGMIFTSYRWTDNHCYILGEFTVRVHGRPALTGSQRIGWDPLAKTFHSWVFDSEGGYAEGVWSLQGRQWMTKLTGVTRDGKVASSTTVITFVGKDRMLWQARDRVVGEERLPDVREISIVRQPPAPK
jgi:uncharacterized protein (TIGR02246 family)